MKIFVVITIIVIWLFTLFQYKKIKKKMKLDKEKYDKELEDFAWKYKSDLKLLQRMVKTRLVNLERQVRENNKINQNKVNAANEREAKIKNDYDNLISKVTLYKVWKLSVKQGMESTVYPDKVIVIAESREAAVQLLEKKYNLDNITSTHYDIVQLKRNKNEILLESYDIL